jgi:hypothetical protein
MQQSLMNLEAESNQNYENENQQNEFFNAQPNPHHFSKKKAHLTDPNEGNEKILNEMLNVNFNKGNPSMLGKNFSAKTASKYLQQQKLKHPQDKLRPTNPNPDHNPNPERVRSSNAKPRPTPSSKTKQLSFQNPTHPTPAPNTKISSQHKTHRTHMDSMAANFFEDQFSGQNPTGNTAKNLQNLQIRKRVGGSHNPNKAAQGRDGQRSMALGQLEQIQKMMDIGNEGNWGGGYGGGRV